MFRDHAPEQVFLVHEEGDHTPVQRSAAFLEENYRQEGGENVEKSVVTLMAASFAPKKKRSRDS